MDDTNVGNVGIYSIQVQNCSTKLNVFLPEVGYFDENTNQSLPKVDEAGEVLREGRISTIHPESVSSMDA